MTAWIFIKKWWKIVAGVVIAAIGVILYQMLASAEKKADVADTEKDVLDFKARVREKKNLAEKEAAVELAVADKESAVTAEQLEEAKKLKGASKGDVAYLKRLSELVDAEK